MILVLCYEFLCVFLASPHHIPDSRLSPFKWGQEAFFFSLPWVQFCFGP